MDGSLIPEIILVVVSVFLSAYFSATETALTSLSELKVKHAISEYGSRAKNLELWITNPNKVLNTILFGNNLVNILASVVAADIMAKIFKNPSVGFITGVMTFVILIFGEITPKTFAKNNALKFAMVSVRFLKYLYWLLYPVTWFMNVIVIFILKFAGKNKNSNPKLTEDELEFLINVGEKEGVLEKGKGEMLTSIFDISDIEVREVMVPRIDIAAAPEEISSEDLAAFISETEFSRIPIYRDSLDNIIGILYVKDIIRVKNNDYAMSDLIKFLRKPLFVPETKKIDAMLREFQKNRLHMAVVLDEYGGTAGIVTMEDILEEIVGDIFDEYDGEDTAAGEVVEISENSYLVDSRMNIDDFREKFGIEKTEDMSDYETLGGFVYDIAGEIPKVGDSFVWRNYKFTVREMKERRIERVEVEKNLSPENAPEASFE